MAKVVCMGTLYGVTGSSIFSCGLIGPNLQNNWASVDAGSSYALIPDVPKILIVGVTEDGCGGRMAQDHGSSDCPGSQMSLLLGNIHLSGVFDGVKNSLSFP